MNRQTTTALVLIAFLAVTFIFNRGSVSVNLLIVEFSTLKSLAFLGFTAIGTLIGMLLK
jgi:uncharacterized integral membrane protein